MLGIAPLTLDNATGYYDGESNILFVDYRGRLTPYMTVQVYQWMAQVLGALGRFSQMRGAVFDFRQVTDLEGANIAADDLGQIPAAIIARDTHQEHLLSAALHLSPQQTSTRIVTSMSDALAFVEGYSPLDSAGDN